MSRHPQQPIETDRHGVDRFKRNEIVLYLLEKGGINMNDIALCGFSDEDHRQFAQLIGYSVGGYADLSFCQGHWSVDAAHEAVRRPGAEGDEGGQSSLMEALFG